MKNLKFDELSLSADIQSAITDMGFIEASPIQSQAIPHILEGKDVIGQAQTGTGKTAAFGIPAIEMIDTHEKHVQAVVMCPTRELAVQVANEIKKLAKYKKGLNVLPIYGGESIERQITGLKRGVQIVIGTPGRIIDHLDRKTLSFKQVKMVVLDEADEMLNMGFREDIEMILSRMPEERQTILFSATMAKPILALTKKYQKDPVHVKVTKTELTVSSIEQVFFNIKESAKLQVMGQLIDMHNLQLMLVFCNTKRKVDQVTEELQGMGYKAESIHGDLRQSQRNTVMSKFRNGSTNILVATDVAARGIDVENVDAVFNYDLPMDFEYYVHRIGRTGRAGKSGKAFSFTTGRNDSAKLRDIENYTKVKIKRAEVPTAVDMAEQKKIKLVEKLKKASELKGLDKYEEMLEHFRGEGFTLHQLAALLLRMSLGMDEEKKKFVSAERPERDFNEDRGRDRRDRGDRGDRGDRDRGDRDRGDRPKRERVKDSKFKERSSGGNGKMVRLFINVGKMDKVRAGDIVGALTGETGIEGDSIGVIDIYDKFSFVEVPKTVVDQVLDGMNDNSIKGRKVSIEVAKD
ncbi:MAG TPA: DEAD/DEAH box helicase [Cytophagaceae bacterium]|jgi:ATP-dependent RNA helicase DeaD|nr:DEAD/DEAH box helicase [Cytophagaceae bacterium]